MDNLSIPNLPKSFEQLKALGYQPKVIFDVGAYVGEFAMFCHSIWPNSQIYCFEPLDSKFAEIQRLAESIPGLKAINSLIGDKNVEKVKFNENETASSVLNEHISNQFEIGYHQMITLDSFIEKHNIKPPSMVKIDTQGFEYQVITGLLKNIHNVEIIIAELNHIDIHKEVKLAEEVIDLLFRNNFTIYDIVEIHRRPLDNAIWQTDFMFVKKNSFLRENKGWE